MVINNPVKTNLDLLIRKNIKLQGSFSHNYKIWEECIKLLSKGDFKLDRIVSKIRNSDTDQHDDITLMIIECNKQ